MKPQHLDAVIECKICHNFDVCKPMAVRRPDAFAHVPEAFIPVWRDDPICDSCEAGMRRVCELLTERGPMSEADLLKALEETG